MPRFVDLPLEIRTEIYRYALAFIPSFHQYNRCEFLETDHDLRKLARPLLTSKWIRAEATPVLFEINEAHVTCALEAIQESSPTGTGWATSDPTADIEGLWLNTTLNSSGMDSNSRRPCPAGEMTRHPKRRLPYFSSSGLFRLMAGSPEVCSVPCC